MARLNIGLLGGSFNPAHDGHRHISVEAMKRLGLDRVWWLVSPQNPLKAARGMAPLPERQAPSRRPGPWLSGLTGRTALPRTRR